MQLGMVENASLLSEQGQARLFPASLSDRVLRRQIVANLFRLHCMYFPDLQMAGVVLAAQS